MSGIPVDSGELRYWREKRVLSCQELAAAAGVASTVVYALENGCAAGRARPETIRKLARALGVTPARLVDAKNLGDDYRARVLRGSGL